MKDIFITGIDTDVGKTIVSSIFVEAFQYDYWKPIQCGNLENSDSKKISSLIQNKTSCIHKEAYAFEKAASPHIAAKPMQINFETIKKPASRRRLVMEGAGGLLVPINEKYYIVDLIQNFDCDVVLVAKNYIGSINHTLSSVEVLQNRSLSILGIVFNGTHDHEIEESILQRCGLPKLLHVFKEKTITKDIIQKYALKLRSSNLKLT